MDLSKFKKLIKKSGDKVIFVEDGEPDMILMSFDEYESLIDEGDFDHGKELSEYSSENFNSFNKFDLEDKHGSSYDAPPVVELDNSEVSEEKDKGEFDFDDHKKDFFSSINDDWTGSNLDLGDVQEKEDFSDNNDEAGGIEKKEKPAQIIDFSSENSPKSKTTPLRLEDIKLEDLPI